MTIVGMLQEISQKVSNIESLLGATNAGTKSGGFTTIPKDNSAAGADRGIDIVLGAQWGDEGKGKLVDVLSQVRSYMILDDLDCYACVFLFLIA